MNESPGIYVRVWLLRRVDALVCKPSLYKQVRFIEYRCLLTGIPALVDIPAPVTIMAFLECAIESAIDWRCRVHDGDTVVVGIALGAEYQGVAVQNALETR